MPRIRRDPVQDMWPLFPIPVWPDQGAEEPIAAEAWAPGSFTSRPGPPVPLCRLRAPGLSGTAADRAAGGGTHQPAARREARPRQVHGVLPQAVAGLMFRAE